MNEDLADSLPRKEDLEGDTSRGENAEAFLRVATSFDADLREFEPNPRKPEEHVQTDLRQGQEVLAAMKVDETTSAGEAVSDLIRTSLTEGVGGDLRREATRTTATMIETSLDKLNEVEHLDVNLEPASDDSERGRRARAFDTIVALGLRTGTSGSETAKSILSGNPDEVGARSVRAVVRAYGAASKFAGELTNDQIESASTYLGVEG